MNSFEDLNKIERLEKEIKQLKEEKALDVAEIIIKDKEIKQLKEKIEKTIQKIQKLPNRDDKLYSMIKGKALSIATLDGGGVGRLEVIKLLEELEGE